MGIETSGSGNQDVSEVGVDAPIVDLVGIRQRIAGDLAADAHMIEFLLIAS